MQTYQEITSATFIDTITHYAETLLGIDLKRIKKKKRIGITPNAHSTQTQRTILKKKNFLGITEKQMRVNLAMGLTAFCHNHQ